MTQCAEQPIRLPRSTIAQVYPSLDALPPDILKKAYERARRAVSLTKSIAVSFFVDEQIRANPGITTPALAGKPKRREAAVKRYIEELQMAGQGIVYDVGLGGWRFEKQGLEVGILPTYLQFVSRSEFGKWLAANGPSSEGVWLLFGKPGGPKTITAADALEEALCYGWIDGQMQSLDDASYIKYFSQRRQNSKWSEKNKALAEKLEKQGLMTDFGREKIAEAKKNGQWEKPKAPAITDEQIAALADLLKEHEPAYTNFGAMSPSVKKTYTRAYLDAKTDAGRASRMAWMVERLNKNLKPM